MKLQAYSLTWRKVLRHPWLALSSYPVWLWLRNSYGLEFAPNKVELFPVWHIVLTDYDLRERGAE